MRFNATLITKKHLPVVILLFITIFSGIILTSNHVSADDTEVVDQINITVPVACTMSGTGTSHTATMNPGTYSGATGSEYENGIGKTTLTAICNDDNGFSIYAIGFTGDSYDDANHTKLVGANTNQTISTKIYASGDTTSNWSMKVNKVTDATVSYNPANMLVANSFDAWHIIPSDYTKVAEYKASTGTSTTDTAMGAKLETTYATYIASDQVADTYTGQVKYTMVHPYDHDAPEPPSFKVLYTGRPLSNVEGQENPVTVRMSELPADGKYNLMGTTYGQYDKLTANTLYGGYYLYSGDFDDFKSFLNTYEVYNGKNMLFRNYGSSQTVDGSSITPTEGATYLIKEVPGDVYLSPFIHAGTSSGNITAFWIFANTDDWVYKSAGFNADIISSGSSNIITGESFVKSLSINIGGTIEVITPSVGNPNANGEKNCITYKTLKNGNSVVTEYTGQDVVVEFTPYWYTLDDYKVTSMIKRRIEYNDMKWSNLVMNNTTINSTITR